MSNITARQVAGFVLKMVRPFPGAIAVMVMVAFIWAIDLSIRPYFLKLILDRVTDATSDNIFALLMFPAGAYFFMAFAISTSHRLHDYFVGIKMIPRLRQRIANDTFGKFI